MSEDFLYSIAKSNWMAIPIGMIFVMLTYQASLLLLTKETTKEEDGIKKKIKTKPTLKEMIPTLAILCILGLLIGTSEYFIGKTLKTSRASGIGTFGGSLTLAFVGAYLVRKQLMEYIPFNTVQILILFALYIVMTIFTVLYGSK